MFSTAEIKQSSALGCLDPHPTHRILWIIRAWHGPRHDTLIGSPTSASIDPISKDEARRLGGLQAPYWHQLQGVPLQSL
jgi:hypothetical protein